MRTIQKVTYYEDADGSFHGVTDEYPKGHKNILCIGQGPEPWEGIETVGERLYSPTDLKQCFTEVEAADVPDEWFEALGYEERPVEPVEPEEPKPNYQHLKHECKFKIGDFDKGWNFEILPSKNPFVVLVRCTKTKYKMQPARVPMPGYEMQPEPEQEPEQEPSALARFVNDSLFPKLLMAGFLVFCLIAKGCI
jgi:hypothetical protein